MFLLGIGTILPIFHSDGNTPVDIEKLKSFVKEEVILSAVHLSIFAAISSYQGLIKREEGMHHAYASGHGKIQNRPAGDTKYRFRALRKGWRFRLYCEITETMAYGYPSVT